ncbi:hypothetical protein EAS62_12275 [Bradyrhizobium zhanjiangense]|uniref:Uncharacterized protein n=1 Tax=Bradyrhizobium zhanjiangense TaxID=1325107 RepID=A0ABY0DPU4_9BRAD|nr:hypothetical protein EAS62_12275 [Bradyrhizobium zhanjiangense]
MRTRVAEQVSKVLADRTSPQDTASLEVSRNLFGIAVVVRHRRDASRFPHGEPPGCAGDLDRLTPITEARQWSAELAPRYPRNSPC